LTVIQRITGISRISVSSSRGTGFAIRLSLRNPDGAVILQEVAMRGRVAALAVVLFLFTALLSAQTGGMSVNMGFASAVAELGMLLRGSEHAGSASYDALVARARKYRGTDADGYRAEFVRLSELAKGLRTLQTASR
jgi:hypothetical protein